MHRAPWLFAVLLALLVGVSAPALAAEADRGGVTELRSPLLPPPRLARTIGVYGDKGELKPAAALGMGILGGVAGAAAGGLLALGTFGVALIGLPAYVAAGAAYGVHMYSEARIGWEILGGSLGVATAVMLGYAGFHLADRVPGGQGIGIVFGVTGAVLAPGVGAWIAGMTDSENLRRKAGELAVVPLARRDGGGLALVATF